MTTLTNQESDQPRSPIRLSVDATMLACGGGLTGFLNYLAAWRELDLNLDVTVYTSRPDVFDAVRAAEPDLKLIPFASGKRSSIVFLLRQTQLGPLIEKNGCDVIMSTNSTVGRTKLPQVIHHRNLLWFRKQGLLHTLRTENATWALRYFLWQKAGKKALAKSAANIFISDYMRNEAEKIVRDSGNKNHTIHNGLASRLIDAALQEPRNWQKAPVLAAVTSDCPHKDNPTLIRMLETLTTKRPEINWQLKIAGGGPYEADKKLAVELGVSDNITWLGFLNRDDLQALYEESLCLVFASSLEAFGNPPLESMSRGCAVIASDCSAMPEVCGDAALLVPVSDAEGFAKAVMNYWDDHELREDKVSRGLKRVLQFQWKHSAQKMFNVFSSVHQSHLHHV